MGPTVAPICERANDRGFPFVSNALLTLPGLRLVFVGTHGPSTLRTSLGTLHLEGSLGNRLRIRVMQRVLTVHILGESFPAYTLFVALLSHAGGDQTPTPISRFISVTNLLLSFPSLSVSQSSSSPGFLTLSFPPPSLSILLRRRPLAAISIIEIMPSLVFG
ncbi:unnamed protein product [Musa banksii]